MNTNDYVYSVALQLQPERPATIPTTSGHQTHAAFLEAVRQADPDLAELLHVPSQSRRPFSVSPLLETRHWRGRQVSVSPEQTYVLRLTLLQPSIYQELMRRFLEDPGRPALYLGQVRFLISQVLTHPESSPWAGYTTWAEFAQARPQPKVTLEFLSPTALSRGQQDWGKKFHLLPNPLAIFESLLQTWNTWAPDSLAIDPKPLRGYLEEHTIVQRIDNLRTIPWRYPRHVQIGFVGKVSYGFKGEDDAMRRQLNTLSDFAFYAGVGYKTTMGMGQVRRVLEKP